MFRGGTPERKALEARESMAQIQANRPVLLQAIQQPSPWDGNKDNWKDFTSDVESYCAAVGLNRQQAAYVLKVLLERSNARYRLKLYHRMLDGFAREG